MENNVITNDNALDVCVKLYESTDAYFAVSERHTFVSKGDDVASFISSMQVFKEKHTNQTLIWIIDVENGGPYHVNSRKRYLNAQNLRSHFQAINYFYGHRNELFRWLNRNAIVVVCDNGTPLYYRNVLLFKDVTSWGKDLKHIDEYTFAVGLDSTLKSTGFTNSSPDCITGTFLPPLGDPHVTLFKNIYEAAQHKLRKVNNDLALSTIKSWGINLYFVDAFIQNF